MALHSKNTVELQLNPPPTLKAQTVQLTAAPLNTKRQNGDRALRVTMPNLVVPERLRTLHTKPSLHEELGHLPPRSLPADKGSKHTRVGSLGSADKVGVPSGAPRFTVWASHIWQGVSCHSTLSTVQIEEGKNTKPGCLG